MSLKQVTMRIVLLRNMLVSWWNSWQMGENCIIFYLIILFNVIVLTLLSLVRGPLLGNGCGSPNHI